MRPTIRLLQSSPQPHKPLIHFLGKRLPPKEKPDPSPHVHPASPSSSLPDSFASYRSKAQQHGPLAGRQFTSSLPPMNSAAFRASELAYGAIGGHTGHELGSVEVEKKGVVFDRSELPERFGRTRWTEAEIEAVGSGGASAWG